jgi:aminomuconate-semialdehyde/2-hydroxymuconate-6-semialdehyde dehydrogenase
MADALNYTTRHAVGIAGLITPWNLPIYLLSWKVAPALAMGNCVIAKPSELTPLSAHALAKIMAAVGRTIGAHTQRTAHCSSPRSSSLTRCHVDMWSSACSAERRVQSH